MPMPDVQYVASQVKIALESADLRAFGDLLDTNVRWGAPDDPTPSCQNRRQVLAWYERGRGAGVRAQVSEVVVVGDRIVVGLTVSGREVAPQSSGGAERWQVLTVRDGRVVDIVGFDHRDEAMARTKFVARPRPPASSPQWTEPSHCLRDDVIELRLPEGADAVVLHEYSARDGGNLGTWVPLPDGASLPMCEALVADWLAGWQNLPSVQGPALIMSEAGKTTMIGRSDLVIAGKAWLSLCTASLLIIVDVDGRLTRPGSPRSG